VSWIIPSEVSNSQRQEIENNFSFAGAKCGHVDKQFKESENENVYGPDPKGPKVNLIFSYYK